MLLCSGFSISNEKARTGKALASAAPCSRSGATGSDPTGALKALNCPLSAVNRRTEMPMMTVAEAAEMLGAAPDAMMLTQAP